MTINSTSRLLGFPCSQLESYVYTMQVLCYRLYPKLLIGGSGACICSPRKFERWTTWQWFWGLLKEFRSQLFFVSSKASHLQYFLIVVSDAESNTLLWNTQCSYWWLGSMPRTSLVYCQPLVIALPAPPSIGYTLQLSKWEINYSTQMSCHL